MNFILRGGKMMEVRDRRRWKGASSHLGMGVGVVLGRIVSFPFSDSKSKGSGGRSTRVSRG